MRTFHDNRLPEFLPQEEIYERQIAYQERLVNFLNKYANQKPFNLDKVGALLQMETEELEQDRFYFHFGQAK